MGGTIFPLLTSIIRGFFEDVAQAQSTSPPRSPRSHRCAAGFSAHICGTHLWLGLSLVHLGLRAWLICSCPLSWLRRIVAPRAQRAPRFAKPCAARSFSKASVMSRPICSSPLAAMVATSTGAMAPLESRARWWFLVVWWFGDLVVWWFGGLVGGWKEVEVICFMVTTPQKWLDKT